MTAISKRRRWPWIVAIVVVAIGLLPVVFRVPDISAAKLRAKYTNAASEFIAVAPGLSVHVRDEGRKDAPVLMLIHGSNASLQTWEPWVARLGDRYRLISLDLPGHGLTGPSPTDDYSAAGFGSVISAVAKAKRLDRFALAGNSMGGWVAWNFANAHPDVVSGLILVDAAGAPSKTKSEPPLAFKIARLPVIRDIAIGITPRGLIEKSVHQTLAVQSVITPAMVDRYWELLRYPGNRAATLVRFSTPRTEPDPANLSRITAPTLILWGREDHLIPVDASEWFAKAIPHAKVIVYDGVGHAPMEEVPDRSAGDVAAFLASLHTTPVALIEAK